MCEITTLNYKAKIQKFLAKQNQQILALNRIHNTNFDTFGLPELCLRQKIQFLPVKNKFSKVCYLWVEKLLRLRKGTKSFFPGFDFCL